MRLSVVVLYLIAIVYFVHRLLALLSRLTFGNRAVLLLVFIAIIVNQVKKRNYATISNYESFEF